METGLERLTKPQQTLLACVAFIAGAGIVFGDFWMYFAVAGAILLCVLGYLGGKKQVSTGFAVVCMLIFTFSAIYADFRVPAPDMLYSLAPKELSLRGQVVSKPRDDLEGKTKFFFRIAEARQRIAPWHAVKAQTLLYIYDNERKFDKIALGDHLEVTGYVNRPFSATNPGQFDYEKYLNRRGVFTMTYVREGNFRIAGHAHGDVWFFLGKLDTFRDIMMKTHSRYLKSPKLELLGGMVFGDYAISVPGEVKDDFRMSGLTHLLAASGMNVGIIFGLWYFLAGLFRVPFVPKITAGMALVAVYSLLTGLPPSVLRAALMLELALVAKLIDRQTDNTLILIVVCTMMLLYNPMLIADIGFQLSFIVTLGLLLFAPLLIEKTKPVPEWLSGSILVPLIAQVFVTPIQAFHFNNFAVFSLLANMLVVPFVSVISFAGFLGSIASFIPVVGGYLCLISDKIAEPFLVVLLLVANFTSHLPGALKFLPKPDILTIAIFYALLLALFLCIKNNFSVKRQNLSVLALTVALLVLVFKGVFTVNHNLEFLFFDVGEGDSALIKTPNNKYILIDTGQGGSYNPAERVIAPYFKVNGIKKPDAIVLSHPDRDHIGGTVFLLKTFGTGVVYDNGVRKKTKTCLEIRDYIAKNHVKETILANGTTVNIDKDLKIQVIRPENTDLKTDNDDSLILYITYGKFSALMMGDAEAESLKSLKKVVKPPVAVIKVGHHGSYNSVNEEFLSFIKPETAVISVGNKFYRTKHPDPEVIWLLEEAHSRILRTDRDFAVKISTDGSGTEVRTYKDGF